MIPTRLGEGGRVAPGIVVVSEEVRASHLIVTAGEVDSGSINIVFDIGSGVSDRNLTVGLCVEVTLDVTGDGLDVGRSVGVVRIVDNFITREEEKEVV